MAEHKTTIGTYETSGHRIGESEPHGESADDPDCPGDGWKLVGAAAADGLLFWFWERQEAPKPRVRGGGGVRR